MVYYHTSGNVKLMRNILIDYGASNEVSPYEYMKSYIEKCPETTEDTKLSWIAEVFLGVQKHSLFLREIAIHMSEELSEEEQEYFMLVFHAVTFKIVPKDMPLLYKCVFNLSKQLLNTFTKFLSNNEVLTYISQVAQNYYDTKYVTEKIIRPLFEWQPYISEMAHSYAEYVKKVESRRLKPPTVPVQLNVLNRKGKNTASASPQVLLPLTPPNSLRNKSKKMLTKSAIDQKLMHIHDKNKQKAAHLLSNVKSNNSHYAQARSKRYEQTLASIRDEIENDVNRLPTRPVQKFVFKNTPAPLVKETAATIKRLNKRIQLTEKEEVEWLETLVNNCRNTAKIEELEEFNRQERERERLFDIERKHLLGQITHEEAVIAKKKLQEDNRKKYEEFLREKEIWNEEIEKWKKGQMEKNRRHAERFSLNQLHLLNAKNSVTTKKKEQADKIKKDSEIILAQALKERQEELERRVNMIKEIKILTMIAKNAKMPKIIDLTETAGIGLLCEMSIAELQERLSSVKIALKEELEKKKSTIKEENDNSKRELESTKKNIKKFMTERASLRKMNKKINVNLVNSNEINNHTNSNEIDNLKKILEEKKKLRAKLSK